MSRGINQIDVWQACDSLLLAGARPTIERVRQTIGRGSPNTVSPYLDSWFKQLGTRIQDPNAFTANSARSATPDPVTQAAKLLWEAAVEQSRVDFDQRLHDGLTKAESSVAAERLRAELAQAEATEATRQNAALLLELRAFDTVVEQGRLLQAAADAKLDSAGREIQDLRERLDVAITELAAGRESARQEIDLAQARSSAAERRAALDMDSERTARVKADRRAEVLEKKLASLQEDLLAERTASIEQSAKAQTELQQLREAAQHEMSTQSDLNRQLTELSAALVAAQLQAHAARAQSDMAERLMLSKKTLRPSSKERSLAKNRAR
ncbi:DNA-binding protein [Roseateles sp. GG27B]